MSEPTLLREHIPLLASLYSTVHMAPRETYVVHFIRDTTHTSRPLHPLRSRPPFPFPPACPSLWARHGTGKCALSSRVSQEGDEESAKTSPPKTVSGAPRAAEGDSRRDSVSSLCKTQRPPHHTTACVTLTQVQDAVAHSHACC